MTPRHRQPGRRPRLLVERAKRNDNNVISNDLVLRVALEATQHPDLATALDDLMLCRGRRVLSTVLPQAAARGEISATRDWSLVADVILAMSLLRVIRGQPLTPLSCDKSSKL
jgi:hypothetical protein